LKQTSLKKSVIKIEGIDYVPGCSAAIKLRLRQPIAVGSLVRLQASSAKMNP
jgi:hypothetical protein